MKSIVLSMIAIVFIALFSCKKSEYEVPALKTDSITYITHNTALVYAHIIDDGGSSPTKFGAILSPIQLPVNERQVSVINANLNSFVVPLTGLSPSTEYYIKTYSESSSGIGYSSELTFITKSVSTFIDNRDGNAYTMIQLGDQFWMGENLRYNIAEKSFLIESSQFEDINQFGRLYLYEIAEKACPEGWHLPTDDEWKTLEQYLGMSEENIQATLIRGEKEGNMLKYPGRELWYGGNEDANNVTGFSALPAGNRNDNGEMVNQRDAAFFWSSSINNDQAWTRYLKGSQKGIGRMLISKNMALSIRCVKNK